jgi:hypothetical protein
MHPKHFTKRGLAIATLPAAAVLAGGVGVAAAATGGGGSGHGSDRPSYHSSVTTKANDEQGSDAAQDLALSKLAKVSIARAAHDAGSAVSGGRVTSIELSNEGGNVVYTADVVTSNGESEVVVDAGNGHVLAKHADNENDHGDKADKDGGSDGKADRNGATPGNGGSNPPAASTSGSPSHR